jgi:predicted DNA-binding protein (MmcQ/YjbR family)
MAMTSTAFDRALKQVRALCLALPESREVEAWGHPTFRAGKKMFASFGGEAGELTLHIKVGYDRQEELLQDERFFPTPYAAHQGWVSLPLDGQTNWKEVSRLINEAYRQVALKRMLNALEEQGGPRLA